jgi:glycosyltransferase involved in cell wall biosynthesis
MSNILITIAICTWNRSVSLRDTLSSIQNMETPSDIGWEVLVINNNCTDDTEEVIASFASALPIRSLIEKQQGLSHARNCAVKAARGRYILWTDDDVIVGARWLAAFAQAFRKYPEDVVFGGPILPKFVGVPPKWLVLAMKETNIDYIYALRNLGDEPITLAIEGDKIPIGANFAIRIQEQRQFPYDPRLGLNKSGNIRGEETDVVKKILGSGASGRWVPNAPVQHVIPQHRQTITFLRNYFVGQGGLAVRKNQAPPLPSYLNVPRWLVPTVILLIASISLFLYGIKRLFCSPGTWCEELARTSIFWGMYLEYRNVSALA